MSFPNKQNQKHPRYWGHLWHLSTEQYRPVTYAVGIQKEPHVMPSQQRMAVLVHTSVPNNKLTSIHHEADDFLR